MTTTQARPEFRNLTLAESPELVYFSSVSGNTHRFLLRLDRPSLRIPLNVKKEPLFRVCRPYVLIVPTYGGGDRRKAVPKQVIAFLNDETNRSYLRGVITSGNTNFGDAFCIAGAIIAAKCRVPELYRFELLGTREDLKRVNAGLDEFWKNNPT